MIKSSLTRGPESQFVKMVLQHRSGASLAITSSTYSRRSAAGASDRRPVHEKVNTGNSDHHRSVGKRNTSAKFETSVQIHEVHLPTPVPSSRWPAALMTVVCTIQIPQKIKEGSPWTGEIHAWDPDKLKLSRGSPKTREGKGNEGRRKGKVKKKG